MVGLNKRAFCKKHCNYPNLTLIWDLSMTDTSNPKPFYCVHSIKSKPDAYHWFFVRWLNHDNTAANTEGKKMKWEQLLWQINLILAVKWQNFLQQSLDGKMTIFLFSKKAYEENFCLLPLAFDYWTQWRVLTWAGWHLLGAKWNINLTMDKKASQFVS